MNELFVTILGDLASKAKAEGNVHLASTFGRAKKAIAAHQGPVENGTDAQQIPGIGPVIATKLDQALAKLVKQSKQQERPAKPTKAAAKPKKKATPLTDITNKLNAQAPPPAKRKAKPYHPQPKSGAWAILVAMLTETRRVKHGSGSDAFSPHGMLKEDIIEAAQHLCSSPFYKEQGKLYSAWDSIKTLIEKKFVAILQKKPAKYAITPEGYRLAEKLELEDDPEKDQPDASQEDLMEEDPPRPQPRREAVVSDEPRTPPRPKKTSRAAPPVVDVGEELIVESISCAHVFDMTLGSPTSTRVKHQLQVYRSSVIRSQPQPIRSPIFTSPVKRDRQGPTLAPKPGPVEPQRPKTSLRPAVAAPRPEPAPIVAAGAAQQYFPAPRAPSTASTSQIKALSGDQATKRRITSVQLIVDTREKKSNTDRTYIVDALTKAKIGCEARSLPLGDFLWIGKTECGEEAVLNCIVERKQLADLISSIADGRYKEQKYRLNRCGLSSVFYLAEGEMSTSLFRNAKGLTPATVDTALASTEVNDGFFVVKTKTLPESIQFLRNLTKHLSERYLNSEIATLPTEALDLLRPEEGEQAEPVLDADGDEILFTYHQFADLNQKTKGETVEQLFAKQLMVLTGCGQSSAAAIVSVFPTPRDLFLGLLNLPESVAKSNIAKIPTQTQGRSVGPSLAKLVYDVYFAKGE